MNFKPILAHIRTLSSLAHHDPARLFDAPVHPVLRERSIRSPLFPFAKITKNLLLDIAKVKDWLIEADPEEEEAYISTCAARSADVDVGWSPGLYVPESLCVEPSYVWTVKQRHYLQLTLLAFLSLSSQIIICFS